MAGISCKSFTFVLKNFRPYNSWLLKNPNSRFYSVFAPDFKEPVVDTSALEKLLQENSEEQILGIRVKPALNYQTCSIFYSPDVERFTNYIMRKGKRDVARDIVRDAFTRVKHIQIRKYNNESDPEKRKDILINPLDVFLLAVKNVTPVLWYVKIRRSGTWYKIPVGITEDKAREKAMKWLIEVSKERDKKIPMEVQLANEIIDAANYEGRTVAKKIEMHKMCEANRGYVNYWWT